MRERPDPPWGLVLGSETGPHAPPAGAAQGVIAAAFAPARGAISSVPTAFAGHLIWGYNMPSSRLAIRPRWCTAMKSGVSWYLGGAQWHEAERWVDSSAVEQDDQALVALKARAQ